MSMWERVLRDEDSGCWIFMGSLNNSGYGRVRIGSRDVLAHRLAYEELEGPIPVGLELDHLCSRRCCINPSHLEPVTHRVNTLRGSGPTALNAAKTVCKRGHPLTAENTYVRSNRNQRECRACRRDRDRGLHSAPDCA